MTYLSASLDGTDLFLPEDAKKRYILSYTFKIYYIFCNEVTFILEGGDRGTINGLCMKFVLRNSINFPFVLL